MAEYLASIFGTEKDKVNCSFYFKIGACRHGDRCSRIHNKPTFSQTIVLQNLYINPQNSAKSADGSHLANVSDEEMQVRFYLYKLQFRSYLKIGKWVSIINHSFCKFRSIMTTSSKTVSLKRKRNMAK